MEQNARTDQVTMIVAAYVAHNRLPMAELPDLIATVHTALAGLGGAEAATKASRITLTPAQIRRSITPDALVSFEDGKPYRTLRRHLTTRGLTPEAYRAKWGLPADYPMVATRYSEQRSALAHSLGLGRRRAAETSGQAATEAVEA